jgi:hypothetical protein
MVARPQVDYAKLCFDQGQREATEATYQSVLAKNSQGYVGYEVLAGRATAYLLGYLQQHRYPNPAKA